MNRYRHLPMSERPIMPAALIDRLLHHCHIVSIRGNSYRMREHRELRHSMQRSEADGDSSQAVG